MERARPVVWPRAAWAGALGLSLAGCTFLIDFVAKDSLDVCDGAACVDASTTYIDAPSPDASELADARDGAPVDAGMDRSDGLDPLPEASCPDPCVNQVDGWSCGDDRLNCEAPADWLYHCVGGQAYPTHCADGVGCLQLAPGSPDTCDPCIGKPNGKYCGVDLPIVPHGANDKNNTSIFGCQGGRYAALAGGGPCKTGCKGSPNAVCSPD